MVDYAPPWDHHLPRDSMQPPHEMSLAQVRKSATALANLLDESKDEQVLKEACLGLCQLFGEGIQNDRIQAILEANVVPKLVALLKPSKSRTVPISVQSAALQVLGNVACGDDRQTQVVIDSDALPCLRSLLFSSDHRIRKEVCWIVSNITESSHQVQDVLDADILPPLLKLLDNQDAACREDATWVLFNLSSNRDPNQIAYLAEKSGVRALCNLLACPKELDVMWKGCGTVAAVALKGLRNILVSGQIAAASEPSGYNKMASLVAEAHGVERIEALTTHGAIDVRSRARLLLERMFGAEPTTVDISPPLPAPSLTGLSLSSPPPPPPFGQTGCSCAYQQHQHHHHSHTTAHYQSNGLYDISGNLSAHAALDHTGHIAHGIGVEHGLPSHLHADGDLIDGPGSSTGSSTDSDPEDDDSDSDLIPPPPAPCNCVLCTDPTPLAERRPRGKSSFDETDSHKKGSAEDGRSANDVRQICDFCSGGGRLGDGRAGLAAKLGRAVRLGHPHCVAVLLSRMTWSQRVAATEAPALLHPGGGPPDGGVGNSLPAVVLAAQLGKPECLALLLKRCRPDLDVTHGKKRLTALAWAAHKSYMRCCQLLIEYGANAATKCGDGVTALHLAASGGGHVAICKLLIDHNAPVNARSAKKQTPLCLAAQKGFVKVVQLLIEHGADANNEDEGKYTPLHLSASNGFVTCVDILLKAGARVDSVTRKGVTPLHYAVQGGHAPVVKLLIAAGAKVNCNRKPLLLIAADDGKIEVVRILLDARAEIDCKANIKAMLDKDIEVFDHLTPLHLAASKSHQEVVELLLRRGANVNEVTSKSKWSALDFAVLNGHAECAVTLLEHGATVTDNCKNLGRNNWTLVQYAAHHGAKDVLRLLIQRLKEQETNASDPSTQAGKSGPFAANTISSESDTLNGVTKSSIGVEESATQLEYIGDEGVRDREENEPYHPEEETAPPQPSHRYDPRSSDGGDEGAFVPSTGYASSSAALSSQTHANLPSNLPSNPSPSNASFISETTSKSRRRVVKEDRQSSMRARELRKRECEASDARERLEEAINQRSVSKLTEAIAHVSKLVLHFATSVAGEGNATTPHLDHGDVNGFSDQYNHGGHIHSPSGGHVNHVSSPSTSYTVSAPLAMEVGLGNEVQKARKILAGLLAEEKRIREVKEREVADTKRENAQVTIKKAISVALDGGDLRSLSRAVTRTTRLILDKEDAVVLEANEVSHLISELEKSHGAMKIAMNEKRLDSLSESLPKTKDLTMELKEKGGDGATTRIFGGVDASEVISVAEKMLQDLREKRERDIAREAQAKYMEKTAQSSLEEAMKSNDIVSLESALSRANDALLSKNSELATIIESAKKVLSKWVKGERRKLRQASNTNDPDVIEKAADAARKFGLQALQSDIDTAKALAQKLRDQSDALAQLDEAIEEGDVNKLNALRTKLNGLGMFSDAERARAEFERQQRALRARALLESTIQDAKTCRDPIADAFASSKSPSDILEMVSTWAWPDAQRLVDLSERTRKHGQSSHALCDTADALAKELAVLGRRVLGLSTRSNDARAIAALIAGYEKSFLSVSKPQTFDKPAGEKAISEANKRLAVVQAMDQESVKAESAQVKVEYALATSRRSAARNRHGRNHSRSHGQASANSVSANGGGGGIGSGDMSLSSPRVMNQNGNSHTEARSHSSLSSDYGDDDGSETESGMHHSSNETGPSGRHGDGSRNQVPKKMRGSVLPDDPGLRTPGPEEMSLDGSGTLTGECSHFYSFKEGTTVLCIRCGHLRSSSNPEWLARVKRRGTKLPPDMFAGPLAHEEPANDLISYPALHGGVPTRSPSDMSLRSLRTSSALMGQHQVAQAYGMSSVSGGRDLGRMLGSASGRQANPMNVAMMLPMLHSHGGQSSSKTSGGHRGRRPHVPLGASGFDPHLHGISNLYAGAVSGERGHGAGRIVGSGPMGMSPVGTYADGTGLGGVGPRMSPEQAAGVHGYGAMGGLGGLDGKNGMRLGGDVVGSHSIGVEHMMGAGGGVGDPDGVARMDLPRGTNGDDGSGGADLGTDFANENFGFDIDTIVDDNPPPGSSKVEDHEVDSHSGMAKMFVPHPSDDQNNGFYQR